MYISCCGWILTCLIYKLLTIRVHFIAGEDTIIHWQISQSFYQLQICHTKKSSWRLLFLWCKRMILKWQGKCWYKFHIPCLKVSVCIFPWLFYTSVNLNYINKVLAAFKLVFLYYYIHQCICESQSRNRYQNPFFTIPIRFLMWQFKNKTSNS